MVLLLSAAGCKSTSSQAEFPALGKYNFQATVDRPIEHGTTRIIPMVDLRFDGVPFSSAMSVISAEFGVPIVWSPDCDDTLVYGIFERQSLTAILSTLARRYGLRLQEFGGVYYIGAMDKADNVVSVVRMPSVSADELQASVAGSLSEHGICTVVGSCLWLSDDLDNVRKIVAALDLLREQSSRSYIAEVFFIRVSEKDFLDLQANLKINQVDIFASSFNVEQLFSMFLDGAASKTASVVDQRPVLYLSEGRKGSFEDGSDITLEKKSISAEGYSTTSGYDKISDGIKLGLTVSKVDNSTYSVAMDLSVAVFGEHDKSAVVPKMSRSSLVLPSILVSDGGVFYAGSLRRSDKSGGFGLFRVSGGRSSDMLTVWIRVRELQR
jgi:hypothetical protein